MNIYIYILYIYACVEKNRELVSMIKLGKEADWQMEIGGGGAL